MKTETIFEAYCNSAFCQMIYPSKVDQRERLRLALLRRLEQGDRAREILAQIAEVYRWSTDDKSLAKGVSRVIEAHSDWLDELPY